MPPLDLRKVFYESAAKEKDCSEIKKDKGEPDIPKKDKSIGVKHICWDSSNDARRSFTGLWKPF